MAPSRTLATRPTGSTQAGRSGVPMPRVNRYFGIFAKFPAANLFYPGSERLAGKHQQRNYELILAEIFEVTS